MPLFGSEEDRTERDFEETLLLISHFGVRDNRVSSGITRALIKKGEKALPGLIQSLNSPNGMVREICVEILGDIGSTQAVVPLLNMLYDIREDIPIKAERALRKIANHHLEAYESAKEISDELASERKRIVDPLVKTLSNPSELMRMGGVIRLLTDLKNEATRALLKIYTEVGYATKEFIKQEVLKIPEQKKKELIPFAGSFKHKEIQQLVIEMLNSLSDEKNLREMVEVLLEHGDVSLELKVFCRLKGLVKAMIEEMEALKSDIRWRALSFLESFVSDDEVLKAVHRRLKDPEKRIRQRALLILGNIQDGFSFEPLLQSLDDADENIQVCALRILVRRNYPGVISLLVKMSVKSKNLRAIALTELAQISPHDYTSIMARMPQEQREELSLKLEEFNLDIMKTLKEELQDLDSEKRLKAAQAIQVIGLPVNVDSNFVTSLTDPDEKVRATLIRTIGVAGNTIALRAILDSFADPDRRVRANAIETYANMQDPELIKRLLPFMRDPDNRVRGNAIKVLLELKFDPAYPALIAMLKSDEELMRLSALWVVEELKETRLKDTVAKMSLMDQSTTVREKALKTLEKLGVSGVPNA